MGQEARPAAPAESAPGAASIMCCFWASRGGPRLLVLGSCGCGLRDGVPGVVVLILWLRASRMPRAPASFRRICVSLGPGPGTSWRGQLPLPIKSGQRGHPDPEKDTATANPLRWEPPGVPRTSRRIPPQEQLEADLKQHKADRESAKEAVATATAARSAARRAGSLLSNVRVPLRSTRPSLSNLGPHQHGRPVSILRSILYATLG